MSGKFKVLFLTFILSAFLCFGQTLSVTAEPAKNVELISSGKYFDRVHSLLNEASKSVFVVMYSFRYYPEYPLSPSNILLQDLLNAKKRGVNVEVLLDVSNFDEKGAKENQKTGEILSRNGVKVHYDKIDVSTHAKVVVIDSRYAVVGSHNWTYYGLSKNNEFSVVIDSEELAKELEKYIIELIKGNK